MGRIDWMEVGKEYNGTDELKERLQRIIARIEWQKIPTTLSMMAGEGIKGIIKEFKIPKVSHVADSHELAPYGLYGIRGHYKNADVDLFVVDEGSRCVSLCCYVTKKGVA